MMEEALAIYLVASLFGGWAICGVAMFIMRSTLKFRGLPIREQLEISFSLIGFYVGGAERLIATTLVVFAPNQLGFFIAGWMALKMAANWARQQAPAGDKDEDEAIRMGHLLALVGAAFSFSFAIAMGLMVNPDALDVWSKVETS